MNYELFSMSSFSDTASPTAAPNGSNGEVEVSGSGSPPPPPPKQYMTFGSVKVEMRQPSSSNGVSSQGGSTATALSGGGGGGGGMFCGDLADITGGITSESNKDIDDEDSNIAPINRIVIPSDVTEINPDDDIVYVVGTRGAKVTKIWGLQNMPNLTELVLRACLVSSMTGVEDLTTLTKLELYDNCIEEIVDLSKLANLTVLDISFNSIRSMAPVCVCSSLKELYIAQNKLSKIEGLDGLRYLEILDLGANRIRSMDGLQPVTSLKSLWLGKNKIENIEFISQLQHSLVQLDVQNNRLTNFGAELVQMVNLRELFLAANAIKSVTGLPQSTRLQTIDLSGNGLSSLAGIENCPNLEEVWMTASVFDDYDHLAPLRTLKNLSCIYLEHSPLWKQSDYKATILKLLPTLVQLDSDEI